LIEIKNKNKKTKIFFFPLDEHNSIGIKYEQSNEDDNSVNNDEDDDDDIEQSTNSDPDSKLSSRQKTQRNRTAFTQEQIAALEKGLVF
jgi:hypothetical protein